LLINCYFDDNLIGVKTRQTISMAGQGMIIKETKYARDRNKQVRGSDKEVFKCKCLSMCNVCDAPYVAEGVIIFTPSQFDIQESISKQPTF
jgi:hypothetical protein